MRSIILLVLIGSVWLAAHAAKPAATRKVALPDVTGVVPASWTPVEPEGAAARFRLAQFKLPRAAGDPADPILIVFYFGPGGGGGVPENVERWKGMFEAPTGGAVKQTKVAEQTRPGLRITTVDLSGTYKDRPAPMAPTFTPRPNYRMLAAAVETTAPNGQGPYWIRLVGPARSVAAQKAAWEAFLASLKVSRPS